MRQDGWNLSPRSRDIFDQFNDIFSTIPIRFNSLLQDEYQRQLAKFHQTSFRHYEVREDDTKMQLLIDVPGIPASNIKVQLEEHGKIVKISGSREYNNQNKETSSATFEQSFVVDPKAVDVTTLSASLADGVLTISVPKLRRPKVDDEQRIIPIETARGESPTDSVSIAHDEKQQIGANQEEVTKEHNDDDLDITEEESI
jgi:HSP20 family molecular chaperone IbpA